MKHATRFSAPVHPFSSDNKPVTTNAGKTAMIIDVIKRHFLELEMAREESKENAKTIKRE